MKPTAAEASKPLPARWAERACSRRTRAPRRFAAVHPAQLAAQVVGAGLTEVVPERGRAWPAPVHDRNRRPHVDGGLFLVQPQPLALDHRAGVHPGAASGAEVGTASSATVVPRSNEPAANRAAASREQIRPLGSVAAGQNDRSFEESDLARQIAASVCMAAAAASAARRPPPAPRLAGADLLGPVVAPTRAGTRSAPSTSGEGRKPASVRRRVRAGVPSRLGSAS